MNWPLVWAMMAATGTAVAALLLAAMWDTPYEGVGKRVIGLWWVCVLAIGPGIVVSVYWLARAVVEASR